MQMCKASWLILAFFAFSLVGCATQNATPSFNARYYPQCYDPIAKLCKDQDNSQEVSGATTGALLGALGGAIIGGLASKDVKGAAIGAAAGAVAGGLTGYFATRLSKIRDRDQRLAEYQKILGENSRNWDLERASVEKAYKCYGEQIDLLIKAARDKKISKADFLARMNDIKSGIEYINTYWADSQHRMDTRLADGESFLQQQEAEDRKLAQAQRVQAQKSMKATRVAQQKQKSKKVADASRTNAVKKHTIDKVALAEQFFHNADQFVRLTTKLA